MFSFCFFTHAAATKQERLYHNRHFIFANHFQSADSILGSKSSGRMQMQLPNRRQMDSPAAHTCRSICDFEPKKKWLATCEESRRCFWSPPPLCVFGESAGRESNFRASVLIYVWVAYDELDWNYLPNEIDTVLLLGCNGAVYRALQDFLCIISQYLVRFCNGQLNVLS